MTRELKIQNIISNVSRIGVFTYEECFKKWPGDVLSDALLTNPECNETEDGYGNVFKEHVSAFLSLTDDEDLDVIYGKLESIIGFPASENYIQIDAVTDL